MRIGIDVTSWSNRRGYGRFARGLLPALLEAGGGHEYVFFVDSRTFEQSRLPSGADCVVVPTRESPTEAASHSGRRSLRDMAAMTAAVARAPLDVFFFPTVYTFFPVVTRARVVLGVHDVIPEDYPEWVFPDRRGRRFWNLKARLAHFQADYVLTVSRHARRGILRHFGHPPERVWVVDEAADAVFLPLPEADGEVLARHGVAEGGRFLVYLGGINPHKNLEALVASLAEVRRIPGLEELRLLLVGDFEKEVFTPGVETIRSRIDEMGLARAVTFTGFVPDDEAVHLLNASDALVLPSLAEGFGLPAVEAAACGTPVVATRNSPLPELLKGGGLFVDPERPEELTAALAELLGDEALRARMGAAALERARELSWERAARQFLELLDRIA